MPICATKGRTDEGAKDSAANVMRIHDERQGVRVFYKSTVIRLYSELGVHLLLPSSIKSELYLKRPDGLPRNKEQGTVPNVICSLDDY